MVTIAGRGPAPKEPAKRARRNKDPIPLRVIEITPAAQPELPEFDVWITADGELERKQFEWPERTRIWWAALAEHPLAGEFQEQDWQYLLDTARLHAAFWEGELKVASELRLREAKYGFTPEDRARLRIQFALADESERAAKRAESVSRERARGVKRAE